MQIIVVLTCFNRCEKTVSCVQRLISGNPTVTFKFIIVDDHSTDETVEKLQILSQKYDITVLSGTGGLFYSGGMRLGMKYVLERDNKAEYLLMVNDDVEFFAHSIEKLILRSIELNDAVIAGATCDTKGNLTYGAIQYVKKNTIKYRTIGPQETEALCDTFNANCVLIPYQKFLKAGIMDEKYQHSLGDFDYGLQLKKQGNPIYSSAEYIGVCECDSIEGTWRDQKLSIWKRLKLKEQPKGAPLRHWCYFLKKNFGLKNALVHSITPYIRIILKR